MIKASIASKIRRTIIWRGVFRFSRDGFNLVAFKTSPQCGHVAALEETGCLQVGQLVSVAILFLLIDDCGC